MVSRIEGTGVALVTPFTNAEEIDFPALETKNCKKIHPQENSNIIFGVGTKTLKKRIRFPDTYMFRFFSASLVREGGGGKNIMRYLKSVTLFCRINNQIP